MVLEVEVISRDFIKPSSPTPHHLQKYQLSFLDQTAPQVFMPLILYYPPDDVRNRTTTTSNHLKKSLSKALTRFYPLAGRLINNSYVDCNDEGADFVEARVNCQLSDVIRNPILNELNKLLPLELDDVTDLNLGIQVNFFECGGIAVAVTISHKVADALSCFTFVNTWAAIASGDHKIVPSPVFGSATLFPPLDVTGFQARTGIVKENIVCKRFVFSASKVAALRDLYVPDNIISSTGTDQYPNRPTRIEALSVFIWNRYVAATQKHKGGDDKIYTVLHAVNLRTRFDPPLPDNCFGNFYQVAITVPSMESEELGNFGLVKKMREAIKSINVEYVEKLRKGENHLKFVTEMCERFNKGEMVSFSFTSLCRFGLYEADFGWGKPVWMGSAPLTFEHLVTFFDTQMGDGIEAWINLKEEDMAKFEVDKELLAWSLLNDDPYAKPSDNQLLE